MLPILDKSLQKEYALLSLLDSDDRCFSCQELAAGLQLSERTIHKYLQSLTMHLEERFPQAFVIERNTALGIRLSRAPWLNIHVVYTQFAQESLTYSFFHAMFLETVDTTTSFCLTHYLSQASLYRALAPMRDAVAAFSLTLDAADMKLSGDEMQLRYFFNNFYLQIYRGYDWPFPDISRQRIMNAIEDILGALDFPMSISDRKHFSYWLAIIVHRMSLRHSLSSPLPAELGLDNEAYHACLPAIERFFQRFRLPILTAECQFCMPSPLAPMCSNACLQPPAMPVASTACPSQPPITSWPSLPAISRAGSAWGPRASARSCTACTSTAHC